MTTQDYTDGSISAHPVYPVATPGDLNTLAVRHGFLNTKVSGVDNGVICNIIPVYAGEVVIDVWARIIETETTANADCDLGFAGGAEVGANLVTADSANNTMFHNVTYQPIYFAANNAVTLQPNNGVALDTLVLEVAAIVVKAFDES